MNRGRGKVLGSTRNRVSHDGHQAEYNKLLRRIQGENAIFGKKIPTSKTDKDSPK